MGFAGGAGTIMHMIHTLKNNRALLKKRRDFHYKKTYLIAQPNQVSIPLGSASEQVLSAIRQEMVAQLKRAQKRKIIAFILALIFTTVLAFVVIKFGHDFWDWGRPDPNSIIIDGQGFLYW